MMKKTKNKNQITVESIGKNTCILINDVVHISLNNNDLRGLQSWKMGRKSGRYCTELYFVTVEEGVGVAWSMSLEYDDSRLSKEILDILKQYV